MSRAHVLAVLALSISCGKTGPPPLTEAMVIRDLGDDEMWFRFHVLRDDCVDAGAALCRKENVTMHDDELAAVTAAGWGERVCEDDPTLVKLTPAGRLVVTRGLTNRDERSPCNSLKPIERIVAHYERTGPPVIGAGPSKNERIVTIPGRWIPNEDGRTLVAARYAPLLVVDRKETFSYWEGRWARHHGGN